MLDLESTNCQVSHRRPRVSVFSQAMHFLFALTLVPVCSLRSVYGLSPSRAKPLPVAVLHLAVDDELEVASRHSTPFRTRSQDLSSPYPVSRRVKTCTKGVTPARQSATAAKTSATIQAYLPMSNKCLEGVRKEGLYGPTAARSPSAPTWALRARMPVDMPAMASPAS